MAGSLFKEYLQENIFPKGHESKECVLSQSIQHVCLLLTYPFKEIAHWSNHGQPWSEIRLNPKQTVMNSLLQRDAKCQGNGAEQWVFTISSPLEENILKRDFWLNPWVVILGSSASCWAAGCDLFGNSKSCISLHFFCAATFYLDCFKLLKISSDLSAFLAFRSMSWNWISRSKMRWLWRRGVQQEEQFGVRGHIVLLLHLQTDGLLHLS